MRLLNVQLTNFRGFDDLNLNLHEQLTVLVGDNGAGKSTVLDALFIALSNYVARLTKSSGSAKRIADTDVRHGTAEASIQIVVTDDETDYEWRVIKQEQRDRVLRPKSSDYRGLSDLVRGIAERSASSEGYLVGETPVINYGQTRAVISIPQKQRASIKHEALSAFAEGLEPGGIDFRRLTYWFRERETAELREQKNDASFVDAELEAVRKAIIGATGLNDVHYRHTMPRGLAFTKNKVSLFAGQLSTGEKVLMALAADLARKLAIINPQKRRPNLGRAIVLIDEIELHLHPNWQRKILPWLCSFFPNCQFVVSTHSPQVIGDLPAPQLRILTVRGGATRLSTGKAARGRDSNYLLESVFGADERDHGTKMLLKRIDRALAEDRTDDARNAIDTLRGHIEGAPPEVEIAEARLSRRLRRSE